MFPSRFIAASGETNSFDKFVPAPMMRKTFNFEQTPESAVFTICGLGFYELFLNGERITRGALAPYIYNPDHFLYYDEYEISDKLIPGENVIGIILGNGFMNPFGGYPWGFQKASWRGPVRAAFSLTSNGEVLFESDETVKTHPSPIFFDEYRVGAFWDAREEIPGWSAPGFDDSAWGAAIPIGAPLGEPRLREAQPVVVYDEIAPVSITHFDEFCYCQKKGYTKKYVDPYEETLVRDVWVYDFGVNNSGVCRLRIKGERGQRVRLLFGELYSDGVPNLINTYCGGDIERKLDFPQTDVYILKGEGEEIFVPPFTYHGFRYAIVEGITKEQATEDLLTYLVMSSDMKTRGGFSCSEPIVNELYEMTMRSDRSNFVFIPTDCPHREKNGWTADAALSAEHMLLHMDAAPSMKEWMRNIAKAQREDGALPGIVPTAGWGFDWGNGPAWDCVCVFYPYYVFKYDGDTEIIRESRGLILDYLRYIAGRRDGRGLVAVGLGDWVQPLVQFGEPLSPLVVTDSITVYDIAVKASLLFAAVGDEGAKEVADVLAREMRAAIRENLVDFETMTVEGHCQTSQALAIDAGIFDEDEIPEAVGVLIDLVHEYGDHIMTGVVGGRRIFHILAEHGEATLAMKMIVRPDPPSIGRWAQYGTTTLCEALYMRGADINSMNHHFWGDIAHFFTSKIAGLRINPYVRDTREIEICPRPPMGMRGASAYFDMKEGRAAVSWKRDGRDVVLSVMVPEGAYGTIRSGDMKFSDGSVEKTLASGEYRLVPKS